MSEVKIPTNADEAAAMALIGMSWLEQNAPERLTELHREIRAEAGRAGFVAAINLVRLNPERANHAVFVLQKAAEYAEQIRKGEVE